MDSFEALSSLCFILLSTPPLLVFSAPFIHSCSNNHWVTSGAASHSLRAPTWTHANTHTHAQSESQLAEANTACRKPFESAWHHTFLHFHHIINLYLTQYHLWFDPLLSCEQGMLTERRFLSTRRSHTECNTARTQHLFGYYWQVTQGENASKTEKTRTRQSLGSVQVNVIYNGLHSKQTTLSGRHCSPANAKSYKEMHVRANIIA